MSNPLIPWMDEQSIFPKHGSIDLLKEIVFDRANSDVSYPGRVSEMIDVLDWLRSRDLPPVQGETYDDFEINHNLYCYNLNISTLKQFLAVIHSIKIWGSINLETESGSVYEFKRESNNWRIKSSNSLNWVVIPLGWIYYNPDGSIIICQDEVSIDTYCSIVKKHWNNRFMSAGSSDAIRHMRIPNLSVTGTAKILIAFESSTWQFSEPTQKRFRDVMK